MKQSSVAHFLQFLTSTVWQDLSCPQVFTALQWRGGGVGGALRLLYRSHFYFPELLFLKHRRIKRYLTIVSDHRTHCSISLAKIPGNQSSFSFYAKTNLNLVKQRVPAFPAMSGKIKKPNESPLEK